MQADGGGSSDSDSDGEDGGEGEPGMLPGKVAVPPLRVYPIAKFATRPFRVLVHLYQADGLPAADENGSSDSYCIVRVGDRCTQTQVRGPFSVAPCAKTLSYDSLLLHRCTPLSPSRPLLTHLTLPASSDALCIVGVGTRCTQTHVHLSHSLAPSPHAKTLPLPDHVPQVFPKTLTPSFFATCEVEVELPVYNFNQTTFEDAAGPLTKPTKGKGMGAGPSRLGPAGYVLGALRVTSSVRRVCEQGCAARERRR
jgi:hypothetical protein